MFMEGELVLKQVQVVFRHGARTPIHQIPNVTPVPYSSEILRKPLPHTTFEYDMNHISGVKAVGFEQSIVNKSYSGVYEGGMHPGQLSNVGMQQCFDLGTELRRRYMEKHQLLSSEFRQRDLYLRSTFIQRTIESLQGVVAGLYGVQELSAAVARPLFHIAYYTEETLYPNVWACERLRTIAQKGKRVVAELLPDHRELRASCAQAISYSAKPELNFIEMRDDLMARKAHGHDLPVALEPFLDEICKAASLEFVPDILGVLEDQPEGLRLAIGPMHDLMLTNSDSALNGDGAKMVLYSSHDSMLMPLLVALNVYGSEWPPYASYLAYELYVDNAAGRPFMKVVYNGQDLPLADGNGCLMPYEEFKAKVEPFRVTPSEWMKLCERHEMHETSMTLESTSNAETSEENAETSEENSKPAGM